MKEVLITNTSYLFSMFSSSSLRGVVPYQAQSPDYVLCFSNSCWEVLHKNFHLLTSFSLCSPKNQKILFAAIILTLRLRHSSVKCYRQVYSAVSHRAKNRSQDSSSASSFLLLSQFLTVSATITGPEQTHFQVPNIFQCLFFSVLVLGFTPDLLSRAKFHCQL